MKTVAIVGAESTGKSTLALALAANLRLDGVLATIVPEAVADLPFPHRMLDKSWEAWAYVVATKIANESRVRMSNIDLLISDRSPLDHVAYAVVRAIDVPLSLVLLAKEWARRYDAIFLLSPEVAYVNDRVRQPEADSDRAAVHRWLERQLVEYPSARFIEGSDFEKRYNTVLAETIKVVRS